MDQEHGEDKFTTLRQRAEAALRGQPVNVADLAVADIQALIHNLQVHQIELELQNEELRRTQLELQAARDRYADLYNFAPVGYFTLDANGSIIEANLTGASLLRVDRSALMGAPLTHFVVKEDRERYATYRVQLGKSGEGSQTTEVRLVGPEGAEFYAGLEGLAVFGSEGQFKQAKLTISDITERKRMEEAQVKLEAQLRQAQKMESIGRLAGGVAHDFNNLLTVILGYSDLLQAQLPPDDPLFDKVVQIQEAAERAEVLTRQLLAFSRKQMLAPITLNLNELITNVQKMLERLIGENIILTTTLQPELWLVKADPGQLEQVMMNLAVNARDAMPTGGRLTIETANISVAESQINPQLELPPGRYVTLLVRDTGHGMDEATLARLFEPFFTTKEQGKGTGLGLATAYGIIKQSGGEITAHSQPGQGATFTIYLPAHQIVSPSPVAPQPQPVVRQGKETILLVEDEKMVRNLIRVALRNYGYTLLEAHHGYQALTLAEQHNGSIDLLLTDVIMPQMSGRELAERFKVLYPHLKVLFMSGYTDDEVIQQGLLTAEVEFMSKPFSPKILAAKVREILDRPVMK